MAVIITGVAPRSPAGKRGIKPGWQLLEINGNRINDVLDYRFYMTDRDPVLKLLDGAGAAREERLKKTEYAEAGLEFASYLMSPQKSCKNKCVFCFIDQLPKGLRQPLYFKDDDSRLGFLFGNYITLTNLTESDIERIIKMRISPVNISVHTLNPELRVSMMKNPRAGEALRWITRLSDAGIKINAQLVLCPGINDGPELIRSLKGLQSAQSVAAVPVGLSAHRAGLPELRLFSREEAREVIRAVGEYENAWAADEFYLLAGLDIPGHEAYGEYHQLENGVGITALLRHEFAQALLAEEPRRAEREITIATGVLAAPEIRRMADLAMTRFPGLKIDVIPVPNRLFGETITVAGLVTGQDLMQTLRESAHAPEVLFPAVMLRRERDVFLDDYSPADLEKELGIKLTAVENDGYEFLDAILGRN